MHGLLGVKGKWEGLAKTDPLWAVCSDPALRNGGWDAKDLLVSDELEVGPALSHLQAPWLSPERYKRALG